MYLIKTDEAGEEQWQQTFGGTGVDQGHCVQCTNDGGYVIVGSSAAIGAPDDIYLIKTDNLGSPVWIKAFSGICFGDGDTGDYGDCGYRVRQTADLGYIVAGRSQRETTPPNIDDDACLLKTDAEGNKLWGKRYGLEYPDTGTGVEQTADGGYILSGYTRSYGAGDFNALLIKTDASGNEQWKRAYGGNGWDRGEGVQLTSDGGFILVSMSTSWGPYEQAWIVKTDSEGIEQWDKHLGGYYEEWGLSLQQTSDEGYILAGKTLSFGAGNFDAYLVYYKPWLEGP